MDGILTKRDQFKKTERYKAIMRKLYYERIVISQYNKLKYWVIMWRDIDETQIFTQKDYKYIESIRAK